MHDICSFTDEGLSFEDFSTVTQIVISVMNLSDMLQQDREDSSVSDLAETQQNRLYIFCMLASLSVLKSLLICYHILS